MAKPGDKVVIPIPSSNETATPDLQPTPTVQPGENWESWWALFFEE